MIMSRNGKTLANNNYINTLYNYQDDPAYVR